MEKKKNTIFRYNYVKTLKRHLANRSFKHLSNTTVFDSFLWWRKYLRGTDKIQIIVTRPKRVDENSSNGRDRVRLKNSLVRVRKILVPRLFFFSTLCRRILTIFTCISYAAKRFKNCLHFREERMGNNVYKDQERFTKLSDKNIILHKHSNNYWKQNRRQ